MKIRVGIDRIMSKDVVIFLLRIGFFDFMERVTLNGNTYAVHRDVAVALKGLTDFVRSIANNTKDTIWQPEWNDLRDRALSLTQELSRKH